ncbi:hypothetical protein E3N88_07368 [Mikania micrantha]|uniref:Uncharacterized protein n=1 Tax=Mikania micrantha TaxID=192012 RepID=A0A5N6PSF6_9ASTR|nr:hypothetical protein E3N88_07368 [Mikania micrantha]
MAYATTIAMTIDSVLSGGPIKLTNASSLMFTWSVRRWPGTTSGRATTAVSFVVIGERPGSVVGLRLRCRIGCGVDEEGATVGKTPVAVATKAWGLGRDVAVACECAHNWQSMEIAWIDSCGFTGCYMLSRTWYSTINVADQIVRDQEWFNHGPPISIIGGFEGESKFVGKWVVFS